MSTKSLLIEQVKMIRQPEDGEEQQHSLASAAGIPEDAVLK
jgi:hypothetical protein